MYATRLLGAIGIHDAGENASARGYHYEYVNVDDATVLGLDLGAEVPLYHTLKLRPSLSFFHGEYDNVREDWLNTPYEDDSRYLSRFPGLSGALRLDWIQGPWTGMLESRYTGAMYIDYAADGDLDNPGSKIHETEEMLLFSAQLGYSFPQGYRVYIGGTNLSNVLQEEKHTDDAAFVYGPLLAEASTRECASVSSNKYTSFFPHVFLPGKRVQLRQGLAFFTTLRLCAELRFFVPPNLVMR